MARRFGRDIGQSFSTAGASAAARRDGGGSDRTQRMGCAMFQRATRGTRTGGVVVEAVPQLLRHRFARDQAFLSASASTLAVASTSSWTCDTDTATSFFSCSVSAISRTFSTPPAPICTGTPT